MIWVHLLAILDLSISTFKVHDYMTKTWTLGWSIFKDVERQRLSDIVERMECEDKGDSP